MKEYQEYPKETKSQRFWRFFLNGCNSKYPNLEDEFLVALNSGNKVNLSLYEYEGPPRFHSYWFKGKWNCDSVEDFGIGVSLEVNGRTCKTRCYNYKKEFDGRADADESIYERLRERVIEEAKNYAHRLIDLAKQKNINVNIENRL